MIEREIAEELIKWNRENGFLMRCVWLERKFFSDQPKRVSIDTYDVVVKNKSVYVNGIRKIKLNVYDKKTRKILIQHYGDKFTGYNPF
jgi:hypothetical protein